MSRKEIPIFEVSQSMCCASRALDGMLTLPEGPIMSVDRVLRAVEGEVAALCSLVTIRCL